MDELHIPTLKIAIVNKGNVYVKTSTVYDPNFTSLYMSPGGAYLLRDQLNRILDQFEKEYRHPNMNDCQI